MEPGLIKHSHLGIIRASSIYVYWFIIFFTGPAWRRLRFQSWFATSWGKDRIHRRARKERKGSWEVHSRRRHLPRKTGHHGRRLRRLRSALDEGVGSGDSSQGARPVRRQISEDVQRGFGLPVEPSVRALTDRAHFPSTTLNLPRYPNGLAVLMFANKYCNAKNPPGATWAPSNATWFGLDFATEGRSQ